MKLILALARCDTVFQQLELDYTLGVPHPRMGQTDLLEVPIVRMFGVTDAGNSVCLFVHGFEPYIYVEAPTRDFGPDDCETLRQHVNVRPDIGSDISSMLET